MRALAPAPGAWFTLGGERIKVLAATVARPAAEAPPGTVIDEALTIACGDGSALRPLRLQRAGKAPMETEAFLRGRRIDTGTQLPCPATG